MRALVVEDSPDVAAHVAQALGEAGFAVDQAGDGENAWFRGDTEAFDAVILDIGMEEGSGLELVPLLRRNGSRTPIVVFTAQDTSVKQVDGVDAVLVKSRASLETLVEQVCGLASNGRQRHERS